MTPEATPYRRLLDLLGMNADALLAAQQQNDILHATLARSMENAIGREARIRRAQQAAWGHPAGLRERERMARERDHDMSPQEG